MRVKIKKLNPQATLPAYQTEHAAAMDISACLEEPITLQPMQRAMIPTGLSFEIPVGTEMQIRARSGLSIKHGISLVNGIGTIDADYRGELHILLINFGQEEYTIESGTRIAQLLIARYEPITWEETDQLSTTVRDKGGFGSTDTV